MQILLVIILGVIELARGLYIGGDGAVAGAGQLLLIAIATGEGGLGLAVAEGVDRRAVLGAAIIALAHALGGIVALPEHPQQGWVVDAPRIEHHQRHFRMPRATGAHFVIARIGRVASGVTHRRGVNPGPLPKQALDTPETPHGKHRLLQVLGEGAAQGRIEHAVARGDRQRRIAPGKRLFGAGQHLWLTQIE